MQNKTNRHILIIDDDPEVIDLLKDFFEGNQFKVGTASTGVEGIDYFKETLPDLVVTDLLLPGEHGINVIKAIKENYFVPVIIMSSIYKEAEIKPLMEDYFVEAFFEKPFDLKELLKKVNDILDAKPV
jgi:two-component system OmpR family response regulator